MKYKELLLKSKEYLEKNRKYNQIKISPAIFASGAHWMTERLNDLDTSKQRKFDPSVKYNLYGMFKYSFCLAMFLLSFFLFIRINLLLTPFSILVFYFFEVHLLFLFPLIIDKDKTPVLSGIKHIYSIGIINVIATVLPIGIFMVAGLFNRKDPFYNWYIGCLSILFWYRDEVRSRL